MKKLRHFILPLVVMSAWAALSAQTARISKEELPLPVANALEKLVPNSTFGGGTKQTEKDGTVKYVLNVQQGEDRIRLALSPEGKLFERSENAKFADLPAPVKTRIQYVCSGEPDMVTKITPGDEQLFYKFSIGRVLEEDGSKRAPGQDNLGTMSEVKRDELPQPVTTTVEKLAPGTEWMTVKLGGNSPKYGPSYMVRTNTKKFFVVTPDGQLHESWDLTVPFAQLPPTIRSMAEHGAGAGEETVIKVVPAGQKPYYRFSLSGAVHKDGTIIPEKE